MTEPIKFFNLSKNTQKKEGSTQPDYRISFKVGDTYVEGGGAWKKTDKNGATYLSCKLGDEYKDHTDETKSRRGWHLEDDKKVVEEADEMPLDEL